MNNFKYLFDNYIISLSLIVAAIAISFTQDFTVASVIIGIIISAVEKYNDRNVVYDKNDEYGKCIEKFQKIKDAITALKLKEDEKNKIYNNHSITSIRELKDFDAEGAESYLYDTHISATDLKQYYPITLCITSIIIFAIGIVESALQKNSPELMEGKLKYLWPTLSAAAELVHFYHNSACKYTLEKRNEEFDKMIHDFNEVKPFIEKYRLEKELEDANNEINKVNEENVRLEEWYNTILSEKEDLDKNFNILKNTHMELIQQINDLANEL